jgi:hypothetical protein
MGYFKTHVVGKIFYLVITVLTIVAFALYVANTTRAYYADSNIAITVMAVAALVCEIAVLVLAKGPLGMPATIVSDVLRVAVPALLFLSGILFLSMRAQSLGQVLGSNLELGNVDAHDAANQAIIVIVLFVVGWLVSVVAAFLKIGDGSEKKAAALDA